MAKAHTELKDQQKQFARIALSRQAQNKSVFGDFTRPDGTPLSGVDISYLACFRRSVRVR